MNPLLPSLCRIDRYIDKNVLLNDMPQWLREERRGE